MPSSRSIRAGAAYVELTVDNSRLVRGLKAAQARLRAFSAGVRDLGAGLLKASALAAAPLAISSRTFAGFSDQIAQVRAVTGAAGEEFMKLTAIAKELGRTTSFTAQQVAQGMTELGRAGYKPVQILAAIPDVLNLARGTATDLGRAAEIAAAAMRGFGLSALDTTRIADVLTATANNSAQTLEDLGEAMKYVAPLAMEAGSNIEDTAAALGVMANNGIKGSMAGTALARAYKNLATDKAQRMLRGLGVEAVGQAGNLRKVADILSDLGKRVQSMGSAKRLAIFEKLFGRGQAAALKLAAPGADFTNLRQTLKNAQGTAKRTSKTMDNTLGGSFRKLMSAVEGVQIAIGEALDKTLRGWMQTATRLAGRVTAIIKANKGFMVSMLKIVAVAGVAGAGLFALGTAGSALAFTIGGLGAILSGAATAVGVLGAALAAILSPIGLVTAGVLSIGAYILTSTAIGGQALQWLGNAFGKLQDRVKSVVAAISSALASGNVKLAARVMWTALKVEWQRGTGYLNQAWQVLHVTGADVFDRIATTAATAWDTVYAAGKDALDKVYIAVMKAGQRIASAFWQSIQSVVNAFTTLIEKVTSTGYALHLVDDKELLQYEQALKTLRKGVGGLADEATNFYRKRIAATNDQQQARGQDLNQRVIQREQGLTDRANERDQAYTQKLLAANQALAKARSEYQAAVSEAAKRKTITAGSRDGPAKSASPKEKLRGAGAAVTDAVTRVTESRGTFNAATLLGLQASSTDERTARAAEETARNTKRLLDEARLSGLTFG